MPTLRNRVVIFCFVFELWLISCTFVAFIQISFLNIYEPQYSLPYLGGHGDLLPTDLLVEQPAGGDGVAGPLDTTVHPIPGLLLTAQ